MKAVIIATWELSGMKIFKERYPLPMLPLLDRPFIQHVVEHIVNQGITDLHIVLCHLPKKIEDFLGDGTRWGVKINYHLVKDPSHPYRMLNVSNIVDEDESLLLVHADRLPITDITRERTVPPENKTVLYYWGDESGKSNEEWADWTGMAWIPGSRLDDLPEEPDEKDFFSYLTALSNCQKVIIKDNDPLKLKSCNDLLAVHRSALADKAPSLMLTGREIEKGIWLSRNVMLQPSARLIPPVYIGKNCRIGKKVQLGPNAVVGKDCVLDDGSVVAESVIFPSSYVGEALELKHFIQCRQD